MSSQSALALQVSHNSQNTAVPALDLCSRIYARNYALHQAAQESISKDWAELLAE
ncbi:MAG: hypothetical protein U0931_22275 [Vulcanimicrobiota bacterium]